MTERALGELVQDLGSAFVSGAPQGTPTSVGHYLEEWELYPRDGQHTPPWLVERLAQAKEWDRLRP